MYLRKQYFKTLEMEEDGNVRLKNNKAFKVYGISTVRLKIFDDYEFILHNLRYVSELK